jgi:RecA-family ATPase
MNTNHPTKSSSTGTTYYTNAAQLGTFMEKVAPQPEEPQGLFITLSASSWLAEASRKPIPQTLFGKFWYQGEICILFADSNLGKSILAVQISNAINTGKAMVPFELEAEAQPVLYCDFELSDKQFEARYSDNYSNHYQFKPDFYRSELNPDSDVPGGFKDFDEYLIAGLERVIIATKAKVVVVDNLTYLRNETEQAKDALPLMKQLKNLKNKYNLSMLVLAHTPKRDLTQQITLNDLQGSKMLMNFCDSAFTIGESSAEKGMRYLKQIKQRNTSQVYGYTNICLCRIVKPFNFLQYEFAGYGNELDHIKKNNERLNTEEMDQAVKLRLEGLSLREAAKQMGIGYQRVDRLIKAADKRSRTLSVCFGDPQVKEQTDTFIEA